MSSLISSEAVGIANEANQFHSSKIIQSVSRFVNRVGITHKGLSVPEIQISTSSETIQTVYVRVAINKNPENVGGYKVKLPVPSNGVSLPVGSVNSSGELILPNGDLVESGSDGSIEFPINFDSKNVTDLPKLLLDGIVIEFSAIEKDAVDGEFSKIEVVIPVRQLEPDELPINRLVVIQNILPKDSENTAYFSVEIDTGFEIIKFNEDFGYDLLSIKSNRDVSLSRELSRLKSYLDFWSPLHGVFIVKANWIRGYIKDTKAVKVKLTPSSIQKGRSFKILKGYGEVSADNVFKFNLGENNYIGCSQGLEDSPVRVAVNEAFGTGQKYLTYSKNGDKPITIVTPDESSYATDETYNLQFREMYLDKDRTGYAFISSRMSKYPNYELPYNTPVSEIGSYYDLSGIPLNEDGSIWMRHDYLSLHLDDIYHNGVGELDERVNFLRYYPQGHQENLLHIHRTKGVPKEEDFYFQYGDDSEEVVSIRSCDSLKFEPVCVSEDYDILFTPETDPLPVGEVYATYRVNYGELIRYTSSGGNSRTLISDFLATIKDSSGNRMVTTDIDRVVGFREKTPFFNFVFDEDDSQPSVSSTLAKKLVSSGTVDHRFPHTGVETGRPNTIEFFLSTEDVSYGKISYVNLSEPSETSESSVNDLVAMMFGEDKTVNSCSIAAWGSI